MDDLKPKTFIFSEESPTTRPLAIQTTYPDLAFDFNMGFRLQIPAGNWHAKIWDVDSKIIFFDEDVSDTDSIPKGGAFTENFRAASYQRD